MKKIPALEGAFCIIGPWIFVSAFRESGLIVFRTVSTNLLVFLSFIVLTSFVFYLIGWVLASQIKSCVVIDEVGQSKGELSLIYVASIFYFVLMLYDFFVNKGGSIFAITDIREEDNLIGSRMSVFGGVIALLSAAPYMLLSILHFAKSRLAPRKLRILTWLGIAGIGSGFLSGGRNAFLIGITILSLQYILFRNQGVVVKVEKSRWHLYLVFIVAVVFSLYLFAEREMRQGVNAQQILNVFSIKWGVDVALIDGDGVLKNILYAILVILIFYFTHAPSYIDEYFVQDIVPYLHGAYNFPIPAKMIEILLGVQAFSIVESKLLLSGVYLTLPGSLYLDFGYFGASLVVALLALVTGVLYRSRKSLKFSGMLFLSYLLSIWILAPLYSVFGISNGFSFLFLLGLLLIRKSLIVAAK
jgi:hypothetical protein